MGVHPHWHMYCQEWRPTMDPGSSLHCAPRKCRAITEMLTERVVLRTAPTDRVLLGAKNLLLKYTLCSLAHYVGTQKMLESLTWRWMVATVEMVRDVGWKLCSGKKTVYLKICQVQKMLRTSVQFAWGFTTPTAWVRIKLFTGARYLNSSHIRIDLVW